jgi:hypothetical protein
MTAGEIRVNRRRHVRVDDSLRLRVAAIGPDDVEAEKQRVLSPGDLAAMTIEAHLDHWSATTGITITEGGAAARAIGGSLDRVEAKLDLIFNLLVEDRLSREDYGEAVRCDISGGGVRFASGTSYAVGQYLRADVFVRDYPPFLLRAVAQVVRVEENEGPRWGREPYRVSLKFVDVAEPVREKLIQYIFRVQREAIRRARAQEGEA